MYLLVLWKGFLAADNDDHILPEYWQSLQWCILNATTSLILYRHCNRLKQYFR